MCLMTGLHCILCFGDAVMQRLKDNYNCGSWAGKLFCVVVILDTLLW